VNGFQRECVSEQEGEFLSLAQIGEPRPVERGLAADQQVVFLDWLARAGKDMMSIKRTHRKAFGRRIFRLLITPPHPVMLDTLPSSA